MKQYLSFFRLKFAAGLQYRTAAIAGLSTQLFFGFIIIMVYQAFYASGESNVDISIVQLTTYVWLGQIFFALVFITHKDNEILKMIRNGDLAYELCRPQNMYMMWFSRVLGSKLSSVALRSFPLLLIVIFLPEPYRITLPVSISAFVLFVLALCIAALLVTCIITVIYVVLALTIDEKGVLGIYFTIADILSGQVVPIPLFPTILKNIATLLPFAYVSDFAFRIYTGNIIGIGILKGFIIQISWVIILTSLGLLLSKVVMKRVVVQGG